MKIFGFPIQLKKAGKQPVNIAAQPGQTTDKKRATKVIKKQIKREVSFEIKDITLALTLIDNPDYPDRSLLLQIYRYIIRDGHLISQLRTARFKVQAEPWLLYKNNQPDLVTTELYNKTWFNQIIEYILDQEFYGYSLVELNNIDPANCMIGIVEQLEPQYVSIEKQWILCEGTILGNYLPYADIKQDIDLLEFVGKRINMGTLFECSYNVIWKYYSRSDWSRANEKVGIPVIVIKADTDDDGELDKMETRAANFGSDGYMVLQKGDEVDLIERKTDNSHLTFKDNIGTCNDEVSKIINGNTATTDTKSFTGSAQVQERTMDDFTMGRLQLIVNNVNDVLIPYLKAKGFTINHRFDYPRLKAAREQKINGIQAQQNTTPEPDTETPPAPGEADNKKQPGKKIRQPQRK